MPITDFLERNAKIYPNDVALVEINPERQPDKNLTWREYNLIETASVPSAALTPAICATASTSDWVQP